jgi:hypothetical protein
VTRRLDDENGIVITVAESGGGMAEATLAKLFLPFFYDQGSDGDGLGPLGEQRDYRQTWRHAKSMKQSGP